MNGWESNSLKRLPEHEADCIDDFDDKGWRGSIRPQLVESWLVQTPECMEGSLIHRIHLGKRR